MKKSKRAGFLAALKAADLNTQALCRYVQRAMPRFRKRGTHLLTVTGVPSLEVGRAACQLLMRHVGCYDAFAHFVSENVLHITVHLKRKMPKNPERWIKSRMTFKPQIKESA